MVIPRVIHELWRQSDHAAMVCDGYVCQPYSQRGDRRGAMDPRAQCLQSVCRAALLFQVCGVVLAWVTPARCDHFVAQHLERFAQIGGFCIEAVQALICRLCGHAADTERGGCWMTPAWTKLA